MNRKEHEQFHRDAARVATRSALLFVEQHTTRDCASCTFASMAALHERAARGEKLFAECCELVTDDDTASEVQS